MAALQAVVCIARHCDCDDVTVRERNRRVNRELGRMVDDFLGDRLANVMPDGDACRDCGMEVPKFSGLGIRSWCWNLEGCTGSIALT